MMRAVLEGRLRHNARGAAAVEFALVLPLLAVMIFGIINYGDMLSVRQSVSQAASEGARAAAVSQGTDKEGEAAAAVDGALRALGQKCPSWGEGEGQCDVDIAACEADAARECATVKVIIEYVALVPGFSLGVPERLTYTAVARVS